MLAEEYLRDGKLDDAFAELKSAVQKDPSNAKLRVFLFQMLTVIGKWESAQTQLEIAGDLDASNLAMVQAYREAIRCEVLRKRVFEGQSSPMVFGEPDRWIALLIESLKLSGSGNAAEAARLRGEAFESAPATSGKIEFGEKQADFEWIADADPRLGPVLEALVNGNYYWIPFHRIKQIDFETPSDLRDFVWTPVHFTFSNGGQTVGFIPTRYCGTDSVDDPQLRLSRKTDWQSTDSAADQDAYVGIGQRMLATDQDEYALLDIRSLSLDVELEEAADPAESDDE